MEFEIRPATEAGRRYVALCEEHAVDFATRADQHDRDGTFPFENLDALQKSGVLSAPLPVEYGGLGIESMQDLVAGLNRLARGDGSTAIAAQMHLAAAATVARGWHTAKATGDAEAIEAADGILQIFGGIVVCLSITEAGTSAFFPLTEATPVEGGWRLNGRKIFGTLSPRADIFSVLCRFAGAGDDWRSSFAFVPRDAEGLSINDDWDALGMRASGSGSLDFRDVFVPEALFNPQPGTWGEMDVGTLQAQIFALPLSAAMLGIAERARELVLGAVTTRRKAPSNRLLSERTGIQYQIAELEIDLSAARAMLERTAANFDRYMLGRYGDDVDLAALRDLMRDYQCTKWVANRKAIDVVDRALTLSGGAGYFNANPLSRLYRDVRAGPFMQTYSPNEAREYIGRSALGLDPAPDL
jgi:alkylation response protein AidB-like acyl-CoA dehydrogenase